MNYSPLAIALLFPLAAACGGGASPSTSHAVFACVAPATYQVTRARDATDPGSCGDSGPPTTDAYTITASGEFLVATTAVYECETTIDGCDLSAVCHAITSDRNAVLTETDAWRFMGDRLSGTSVVQVFATSGGQCEARFQVTGVRQ